MGEEVGAAVVVAAAENTEDVAKKGELVRKSFKTFKVRDSTELGLSVML